MVESARAQILSTASRLFFEQGYAQTGINQLIVESEVARRTFYHHFASKEALGAAYLDAAATGWLAGLSAAARGRPSAVSVVRAIFAYVERFARETRFRGCGILNLASEFANAESAVRAQVREHKQTQRELIVSLLAPFAVRAEIACGVHVLLEGAIAAAAGLLELSPIRSARRAAALLVTSAEATRAARRGALEPARARRRRSPRSATRRGKQEPKP